MKRLFGHGTVSVAMLMALVETKRGCTTFSLNISLMHPFLASYQCLIRVLEAYITSGGLQKPLLRQYLRCLDVIEASKSPEHLTKDWLHPQEWLRMDLSL